MRMLFYGDNIERANEGKHSNDSKISAVQMFR